MARSGKRKEKRRTFEGCAVFWKVSLLLFIHLQRAVAADGFKVEDQE
jgi:hypothetical protein